VNEEVSRDMTGEADGINQAVDSRDACLKERSAIVNKIVGWRERVTADEKRVLGGGVTIVRRTSNI